MDIYLYNTLTKEKDIFKPINEKEVKIYSCGPTVYKDATIGNMRTNIFQDILRRMLKYNGYTIKHVMNITDVGHLVSDGDEGEDKMIKSAREEHKTPLEIAEHYTKLFSLYICPSSMFLPSHWFFSYQLLPHSRQGYWCHA